MLLRVGSVACLCFACACATAQSAREPTAADDAALLRDRVARLERRLSDVDAKIGLLLAQRAPPRHASGYPPTDDAARQEESSVGAHASSRRSDIAAPDEGEVILRAGQDGVLVVDDATGPLARRDDQVAADPPSIELLYAEGQAHLKARREAAAIDAFEQVLTRGPEHDLADNALYWLGAAQLQRGAPQLAVDAWQRLPQRFPRSPKIPDALFGMAQAHEAMGEPALAETLYDELVTQYPRAERARDAKRALRRLRP